MLRRALVVLEWFAPNLVSFDSKKKQKNKKKTEIPVMRQAAINGWIGLKPQQMSTSSEGF